MGARWQERSDGDDSVQSGTESSLPEGKANKPVGRQTAEQTRRHKPDTKRRAGSATPRGLAHWVGDASTR